MKQFKNHNYKIVEKNDDVGLTVIEKDNITATFTLNDFKSNLEAIDKTIRELKAKFNHEEIIMKNIEEHHPFVKELSEQDLNTVWLYREAREVVNQYAPRIKQFEEARDTEAAELEYVKKKLFKNAK